MWHVKIQKILAGSLLIKKPVRLQTEYMGIRKTRVTLHGVFMNLTEEQLGILFSKFGEVGMSQTQLQNCIATGDYVLQITISRKNFMAIPDIISCCSRNIFVIVEGRRSHCRYCGVAVHLSKACYGKNSVPKPATPVAPATTT